MATRGAESSGCETTHACRWIGCTSSDHSRNPWRTDQTEVVRVERRCRETRAHRLGNRASVTHSAMCTRRMQELLETDEVSRVRLELGRLRQPEKVLVEQPPAGVIRSDESEEDR